MKKLILLCAILVAGCSSENERAHSYVLSRHFHESEKICADMGGVKDVSAYWCSGRGCSYHGYSISGHCVGKTGVVVGFSFYDNVAE